MYYNMHHYFSYWGWPKQIADIYDEAVRRLNVNEHPLLFGPAHIVWEDENFSHYQHCLNNFDEYKKGAWKLYRRRMGSC